MFKIGQYVRVCDQTHFLFGQCGQIVPHSDTAKSITRILSPSGLIVDFGKIIKGNSAGEPRQTHEAWTLRRKTGYVMLPHEIERA